MRRRSAAAIISSIAGLAMLLVAPTPALAIGSTPDPTWMTNGKVFANVTASDRIYVGGQFHKLRETPPGTPGRRILTDHLGALDLSTGEGIRSFTPSVSHSTLAPYVRALAVSSDGSTLYVGGRFDAIDGVPVRNLAAIDTSDGAVDPGFAPQIGAEKHKVFALTLSADGSTLYVGGAFGRVNGVRNKHVAALDASTGEVVEGWSATPNSNVRGMDLSPDGSSLYLVGAFSSVDGQARESIARLDAATGGLDPWAVPAWAISGPPMTGWSVDSTSTVVYGGFGRGPNWFGAYRASTGEQLFRRGTAGNVQKVLLSEDGTQLFVGGHFGTGRLTQTFTECGSSLFRGLLIADPTSGEVDCTWIPKLEPFGNNYDGIWDLDLTATHLWAGGKFRKVSDVDQANIARFVR